MLTIPHGIFFSKLPRSVFLAAIALSFLSIETKFEAVAATSYGNVMCRENFSEKHREVLAAKLRKITGWPDLNFDESGILRGGTRSPVGGSQTARDFLASVLRGSSFVALEDASNDPDVAFCLVNPGRWKEDDGDKPPAYVVQIDFADFEQVVGDKQALEAFDVGWGFLHELDHVVNDSRDATLLGEAGECETRINQMRRECNLPERTAYFYSPLPLTSTGFNTRLVRLAFEQEQPAHKKKRYWLVWDANVVGGVDAEKQIASLR